MRDEFHSRSRVVELCRATLNGELSVLLAARELASLLRNFEDVLPREDVLLFRGIDSETDDLPIGSERQYWNEQSLNKKDIEIADYESKCKPLVVDACKRILLALSD